MAFTKAYAKIIAGMLEGETLEAFRCLCGKIDHVKNIPESVLNDLQALELVKPIQTDSEGRALALLTNKGKKVAEFI